ncbi:uncharacterized protein [Lepeophtheirus salmonis]|uniref:uncharacterized protein isoform X3 n=1 Tax=Lepeophtheirus salmonis TaxID=72036 RepID=UPI003AF3C89E
MDEIKPIVRALVKVNVKIQLLQTKKKPLGHFPTAIIWKKLTNETMESIEVFSKNRGTENLFLVQLGNVTYSNDQIRKFLSDIPIFTSFYWICIDDIVLEINLFGKYHSPIIRSVKYDMNGKIKKDYLNFNGIHFKTYSRPWYSYLEMNCSQGFDSPCNCTGKTIQLTDIIANILNFTYSCYMTKSTEWGFEVKNKVPVTLLEHMAYGISDFGLPILVWTEKRNKIVDFVKCSTFTTGAIVYNTGQQDLHSLFRAFSKKTWILLLTVLVISILFIGMVHFCRTESYFESQSYRLLITSLSFMFVILYAYFSSVLVMLGSTKGQVKFNKISDFLADSSWRLIHIEDGITTFKRRFYDNQAFLDTYDPKKFSVPTIMEGLEKAKNGKVAYVAYISMIQHFIELSYYNKVRLCIHLEIEES